MSLPKPIPARRAGDVEHEPGLLLHGVGGLRLSTKGLEVDEIYRVKGAPHLRKWWVRLPSGNLAGLEILDTELVTARVRHFGQGYNA